MIIKTIATVDDAQSIRTTLNNFAQRNYNTEQNRGKLEVKTLEFPSGFKLFDYLNKKDSVLPDIIFLDIDMEYLDGLNTCLLIKQKESLKHIPVILLSGNTTEFDRSKGKMYLCDEYLAKPMSNAVYKEVIHKYLNI